ncbi:BDC_1c_G0008680.mRNA.1.CDS.1 [Saccharomyces cerevisiae]|nr:BDF_1d_G0008620.mRNA.1.CDS.1 [Saccharomyces cerevisiae]CAI4329582.1 BDC_1c_G0008680.mRNA.1.CDS.1 [Saccharomyces cerevisiae]CAI7067242.1 BDF_1d_G0008620.mRNA.1.CDS.1 [Saccharomyces cerevisiae]CAI7067817.1 BDC_1c_G0008680.mRNA.1.CDS.1 [Saccharomyces cerevisiae]
MSREDLSIAEDLNQVSKPLLKVKLLEVLGQGDFKHLKALVDNEFQPKDDPSVQQVLNLILHYAVQVAPILLIKEIVAHWVDQVGDEKSSSKSDDGIHLDLNYQDENGNTPLHLAAAQSRSDVISFLLSQKSINDCIKNKAHQQPLDMCKDLNVAQMIQLKRDDYFLETVHSLRAAMNKRDFSKLDSIWKNPRNLNLLDINGIDPETGTTLLYEYSQKKDIEMCQWLLKHGAEATVKDGKGRSPLDLVKNIKLPTKPSNNVTPEIKLKNLLEKNLREQAIVHEDVASSKPPTYKGFLKKWTNFAHGYKLRWFILSADGNLSYYKDQSHVDRPRGTLKVSTCRLHIDSSEKLNFELLGGITGTTRWRLKGNHPIETTRWVSAIQSAIRFAKDKEILNKKKAVPPSLALKNKSSALISHSKTQGSLPEASQYYQHTLHKEVIQPSSGSLYRRPSNNLSVVSSEIQLNDNLTESGKRFVSKMIENRLDGSKTPVGVHTGSALQRVRSSNTLKSNRSMQSGSGVASPIDKVPNGANLSQSNTTTGSTASLSDNNYIDNFEGDEANSDDEEEDLGINFDRDEEYIKAQYGPYKEKLDMYEQAISIELSSLIELIEQEEPSPEVWLTIKKSLINTSTIFGKLKDLTYKRDKRLVDMVSKQGDVNNVWVQSVKELEMELSNKTERLASIDKERRGLKKILHKKLLESHATAGNKESLENDKEQESDTTASTLGQIAKFISATKEEDEASDADEFYDAAELVDEVTELTEAHPEISAAAAPKHAPPRVPNETDNDSQYVQDEKSKIESNVEKTSQKFEKQNNLVTEDEPKTDQSLKNFKAEDKESQVKEKTKEIASSVIGEKTIVAVTTVQKRKEEYLLKEGSYLGYEDGIRKRLSMDKDDRPKISLWAVLKSMVGKDMTRMTLPVTFNEPTSLLQRVAEDLEYSELLDQAATFEDSTLRTLYVAAFTASSYASTTKRVAKPFNPLLGETFEYSRPDKQYRFFTEQVSHHPPISATWTESPRWDFWGESFVDTKFNGRSFNVKHLGLWHIKLRPNDNEKEELYTWKKPNNTVIGILIGNPQVDNHGEVNVVNHTTGDHCKLYFKARGWRSSGAYEITGEVYNKKKQKVWILGGHWNEAIFAKKVVKDGDLSLEKTRTAASAGNGPTDDGTKFLIWKANDRPEEPFNLTPFAITLNAPQPHLLPWLPPTDTRLRPDQRAMEDGRYDEAGDEKFRVEEKQRAARRKREENNLEYHPQWFVRDTHPITKAKYWRYTGKYWVKRRDHDLKDCGDIF